MTRRWYFVFLWKLR